MAGLLIDEVAVMSYLLHRVGNFLTLPVAAPYMK